MAARADVALVDCKSRWHLLLAMAQAADLLRCMGLVSLLLCVAIAAAWAVFGARITELMAPVRAVGRRRTLMPLSLGDAALRPDAATRTWHAAPRAPDRAPLDAALFAAPDPKSPPSPKKTR